MSAAFARAAQLGSTDAEIFYWRARTQYEDWKQQPEETRVPAALREMAELYKQQFYSGRNGHCLTRRWPSSYTVYRPWK